jgi:hypothetical protein
MTTLSICNATILRTPENPVRTIAHRQIANGKAVFSQAGSLHCSSTGVRSPPCISMIRTCDTLGKT